MDRVLAAYEAAYQEHYDRAPAITPGDRSTIGRLLMAPPKGMPPAAWVPALVRAVAEYVGDHEDALTVKTAHPLRLFPGAVNRFLAADDFAAPKAAAAVS